jgi:hypothetical protein
VVCAGGSTRKYSFLLIFLGLALIGVSLIALVAYGESTTITCAKAEGGRVDCTKQTRWLNLWQTSQPEVFPHITQARVEISCSTDFNDFYRCASDVLSIENEQQPLKIGSPYVNEETAAETSTRINDFIRQPDESPLVIDAGNTPYFIFGFIFVVVPFFSLGAILLWAASSRRPTGWFRRGGKQ